MCKTICLDTNGLRLDRWSTVPAANAVLSDKLILFEKLCMFIVQYDLSSICVRAHTSSSASS